MSQASNSHTRPEGFVTRVGFRHLSTRTLAAAFLVISLAVLPQPNPRRAAPVPPAHAAESIRAGLVQAQLLLPADPATATRLVDEAAAAYQAGLAGVMSASAPEAHQRALTGFEQLLSAAGQAGEDQPADVPLAAGNITSAKFAAGRARVWTAILAGAYLTVEGAVQNNDPSTAEKWLQVREFRTATRFSRPGADATLAVEGWKKAEISPETALLSVQADLLDAYQARLAEALRELPAADANAFPARRAELAALAEGYFWMLSPAYEAQRGRPARIAASAAFAALLEAALVDASRAGGMDGAAAASVDEALRNFRAAPLSPSEKSRRAGQLLRFLSLVPLEYGRGVSSGRVTQDFEIQEALTFYEGGYAAFSDLENLLGEREPAAVARARVLFDSIGSALAETSTGGTVANPASIQSQADELIEVLRTSMPEEWLKGSAQGDYDVIDSLLDQMVAAARSGEYELAESSRLEAYAVLETGPEARLMIFAPELKLELEELFWNGQGASKGLAYLIKNRAPAPEIIATREALEAVFEETQARLGERSAPPAMAANAALIVFREGLEAVVILAALLSSMKRAEERKYRLPMWVGTGAALLATGLTWLLAREVLQSLARYGEKLEAVVSLIAIGVLLLITNWFFHKVYWTNWIASFQKRKRTIITGEAGLWLGLAALGFTSVYREGFETVLFLQALVLEGGPGVVLSGVGVALLGVGLVGLITFRLQANLPYKKMLIITGVLIGGVLLQMVGKTVHVLQVVGWMPIHLIDGLPLPYWLGTWFGVYPTWEGFGFQALAAVFVIGSYLFAEYLQRQRRTHRSQSKKSLKDSLLRTR